MLNSQLTMVKFLSKGSFFYQRYFDPDQKNLNA